MLNPERVFRDEVCYLEGSSQDGEVIHAACETNNNGGGRVRRRRRWPEPSQPGPDAGVILTNSTARDAEAAGHPERTPTRASRPEQKLRAPQTTSVQLKKIPTKTPPICCTSDTCAFLAAISGGSPLRPPPRPSTVLAQILSLPGPEPGLLTGARCVRAPGPSPAPVRPLPHQSSFCEHLHLQASSSAPRSSSSFLPVAHRVCALRTRSCTRSRARGFGDRGGARCTVSRLLFAASVRTLWLALSLTTCYGSPPSVLTCHWFACYVLLFSWFL